MPRSALIAVLASTVLLVAAAPATSISGAAPKPPPASVCVPSTIRMERIQSLPPYDPVSEYDAKFQLLARVNPTDAYYYKCLWVETTPADEAFVVFISFVSPGVPGRIVSGNCDGSRKDSHPFYHSKKRYLSVSGGERKYYQRAKGGNEKVIKAVLAAAEAAGVGQACPGAPQPKPKPKPQPKPPWPSSGALEIDFTMPTRFGLPGKNGLIEYHDGYEEIDPDEWRVNFTVRRRDGKPCAKKDTLEVGATGSVRQRVDGTCTFHVVYRREGFYDVDVTLAAADGKRLAGGLRFPLQDWLLVGLGDSNGSGEGAPDVPRKGNKIPRWQSSQCHRSANSYQAQTARAIERGDSRTSVTFVHLACSGATIVNGVLEPYEGIEPDDRARLPAQVDDMKDLVGRREVDAVLISVGVNDLKFGAMAGHCISENDCPNVEFPTADSPRTLTQEIARLLRLLPNRYAKMAAALQAAGVDRTRIHLSEYFDSTRDEKGTFCNPLIRVYGKGTFDQTEAKWAHDRVLLKLNEAIRSATGANKLGRVIEGAYASFREHGYCSKSSWIVNLTGSFLDQLNKEGTLHSTTRGNFEQAKGAIAVLRGDFYETSGRARLPRR